MLTLPGLSNGAGRLPAPAVEPNAPAPKAASVSLLKVLRDMVMSALPSRNGAWLAMSCCWLTGDPIANIKLLEDPGKNLVVRMKDGKVYKNTL
jgi:hypothetical protein